MKKIEIDDELYQYIASNTQSIGESASTILRRLLNLPLGADGSVPSAPLMEKAQPDATTQAATADDVPAKGSKETAKADAEHATKKSTSPAKATGSVFNVLNKEELQLQKGAVGRFLFVLSALHRVHKGQFDKVLDIKGRDRIYFAKSKDALVNSGSSTNPKNIEGSDYWVITNSNTTRKKMMLHEAALSLGYSESDAETIRDFL